MSSNFAAGFDLRAQLEGMITRGRRIRRRDELRDLDDGEQCSARGAKLILMVIEIRAQLVVRDRLRGRGARLWPQGDEAHRRAVVLIAP